MNTSEPDPFDWIQARLQALDQQGLRRRLHVWNRPGTILHTDDEREIINFGANDYLGLAAMPLPSAGNGLPVTDAANQMDMDATACRQVRTRGSGASPLVCGYSSLHEQLCQRLACLEETESTLLFASGYAACSGVIAALAQPGDLILSDRLNHAALIDGCRLSRAERFIYPHRDVAVVQALLKHHRHRFVRAWIVTDSVFSMDGTVAPLAELSELARRYDATLLVDEAHATGVLGDDGSGGCAACGVKTEIPIRIGTLSKAVGSHGGFVVGPQIVTDFLLSHCRSLIYSTAATPTTIATADAGVQAIQRQPELRTRLRKRIEQFHNSLPLGRHSQKIRQDTSQTKDRVNFTIQQTQVPIIPIHVGSSALAVDLAQRLLERGFYVPAIRPPTVPQGTARLRVSLSAAHTPAHIEALLDGLRPLLTEINARR